jgi:phosphohistidine phosphatase
MEMYFLRHADAEEQGQGKADSERALTAKGMRQSVDVAKWAAEHKVDARVVVTSPLLRARQTAEPMAAALDVPLVEDERLSGGRLTISALEGIVADQDDPEAIMIVGHEPDFSEILGELTGGRVAMKKAALAMVRCDRVADLCGELVWLTTAAGRK